MKSGSGAFDIDDFVSRLVIYMGGRKTLNLDNDDDSSYDDDAEDDGIPLDWEKVGRKVLGKSHRVPVMDFMCVNLQSPYTLYVRIMNCAQAWTSINRAEETECGETDKV